MRNKWTPEQDALLHALWLDSVSAKNIAVQFQSMGFLHINEDMVSGRIQTLRKTGKLDDSKREKLQHDWTPKQDELVITLWMQGVSAAGVAKHFQKLGMSDVNRLSVISHITTLRKKGELDDTGRKKPSYQRESSDKYWTPEQSKLLKTLWMEGVSAEAIATHLQSKAGNSTNITKVTTRSAILGHLRRMREEGELDDSGRKKLPPTAQNNSRRKRSPPKPKKARQKRTAPTFVQTAVRTNILVLEKPEYKNFSFQDLPDQGACRTVVVGTGADSLYCGNDTQGARKQYCEYHAIILHQSCSSRRKEKMAHATSRKDTYEQFAHK